MALYRVVSEIFNVEKCRDLEIGVRVHSRSLKVVLVDRSCMVSYISLTLSKSKWNSCWQYLTISILSMLNNFIKKIYLWQNHWVQTNKAVVLRSMSMTGIFHAYMFCFADTHLRVILIYQKLWHGKWLTASWQLRGNARRCVWSSAVNISTFEMLHRFRRD